MRVYSWNILFKNTDTERVGRFLSEADFDVLCLQEVPESFLPVLKESPYNIVWSPDFDRPDQETIHLVILSKEKIVEHSAVPFPEEWYTPPPLLGRVIGRMLGWYMPYKGKTILTATLESGVHVVCLHLSVALAWDELRRKEMEYVFEHLAQGSVIVCGDLNVLESYRVNWINVAMGGPWSRLWDKTRERKLFEGLFRKHAFANPLRGECTHAFSGSQLDHILLSEGFTSNGCGVVKNTYGSDHNPVYCEIV